MGVEFRKVVKGSPNWGVFKDGKQVDFIGPYTDGSIRLGSQFDSYTESELKEINTFIDAISAKEATQ